MNNKLISKRIDQLKTENDRAAALLQQLDIEKQKTINDILIRNGRILELTDMLKEKENR